MLLAPAHGRAQAPGAPPAAPPPAAPAAPAAPPPDAHDVPVAAPPAPEPAALTKRPSLLHDVQPAYPPEAWEQDIEGDVVVVIAVDETGAVKECQLVSSPGHGLGSAAVAAAKQLRFSPAETAQGPVAVRVRYTFRFRKPEKATVALPPDCLDCSAQAAAAVAAAAPKDLRPTGALRGIVMERGTGDPMPGVEVYVLDLDEALVTDDGGRFERKLPPGGYALTVLAPGFYPLEVLERIDPGEALDLKLFLTPERGGRYHTTVWGEGGRELVGRTRLTDAEIYEVPGTMGDPIRVVMLMPGVTTSVTGLGYPVVRGVLPGDTRYEVDGVQVPMLYHLMFGNAVVNPRFTSGITFQPGGYSARHGGFPGALIQADGANAPDEPMSAADVSIVQSSVLHARPIDDDLKVLAAARYGTLGLIIEGLASNAVLRFWDYQSKAWWRASPKDRVEVTVFGAGNAVGEELETGGESVVELGFHRGVVRWRRSIGAMAFQLDTELGQEASEAPPDQPTDEDVTGPGRPPRVEGGEGDDRGEGDDAFEPGEGGAGEEDREGGGDKDGGPPSAEYRYAALRARGVLDLTQDLELSVGAEAELQDFGIDLDSDEVTNPDDGLTLGAFIEGRWTAGPLSVTPGVRVDHYRYGIEDGPRATAVDPRLAVGYEVTEDVTAKASVGVYSGPPRVTLVEPPVVIGPVPGIVGVGLDHGLSRAVQTSAGVDVRLPERFELRMQSFFSHLTTGVDFSLMNTPLEPGCVSGCPDGDPGSDREEDEEDPPVATTGRSYGLELMLRRRLGESVFGWLTYSLTRSERDVDGIGTLPFMFDQTHVINAVLSWEVGRSWTLGTTFHFHTGRPYTPETAAACEGVLPPTQQGEEPSNDFGFQSVAVCRGTALTGRLPAYWRIDARVQKRELFDTWYFDFYIDIINVTFNWETIGYEQDGLGGERPVVVPLFIPMLGLRARF